MGTAPISSQLKRSQGGDHLLPLPRSVLIAPGHAVCTLHITVVHLFPDDMFQKLHEQSEQFSIVNHAARRTSKSLADAQRKNQMEALCYCSV